MENSLNNLMDRVVYELAKKRERLIEQCFERVGFDMEYVMKNPTQFSVTQHSDGRVTYRHIDKPLFTVFPRVEEDLTKYTLTATFDVLWWN